MIIQLKAAEQYFSVALFFFFFFFVRYKFVLTFDSVGVKCLTVSRLLTDDDQTMLCASQSHVHLTLINKEAQVTCKPLLVVCAPADNLIWWHATDCR